MKNNKVIKFLDEFFFYDEEKDSKFNHWDVIMIIIVICLCAILGIQKLYEYKYSKIVEDKDTSITYETDIPETTHNSITDTYIINI